MNGPDYEQLTLFPAASRANPSPKPDSAEARAMTATSGRRCLELSTSCGLLGSLERMLLTSSIWHSTMCFLTWKVKATPHGRLWFQLAASAPHQRYRFAIVAHADGDGRGGAGPAPAEGRDIHQVIASMPESGLPGGGGTGNLNPEWTEWLMGFPTGWTELDASETRCARPSSSPSSNKSD